MASKSDIRAEADRILARFASSGAETVETDILMPAGTLLDLYGEDIRARAFVTQDPLRGEQMLRPDFTVSVAKQHLSSDRNQGRYAYSGEVFRRQEDNNERPREYLQVGYEVFGGDDPAQADADVFAQVNQVIGGVPIKAAIGDIGFLVAAVNGLSTTDARKSALLRHIWHPSRFRSLMKRFSQPAPPAPTLGAAERVHIGLRSLAEVEERIAALRAEEETPPISADEAALIDAILAVRGPAPTALELMRELSAGDTELDIACDRMARRLNALENKGISTSSLLFEASYGRTSMEYYDGFVFGFSADNSGVSQPLATGGRYDALTRALGNGTACPAVGGVVRPDLLIEAQT